MAKKILGLVLAAVMIMALAPTTVFAESDNDWVQYDKFDSAITEYVIGAKVGSSVYVLTSDEFTAGDQEYLASKKVTVSGTDITAGVTAIAVWTRDDSDWLESGGKYIYSDAYGMHMNAFSGRDVNFIEDSNSLQIFGYLVEIEAVDSYEYGCDYGFTVDSDGYFDYPEIHIYVRRSDLPKPLTPPEFIQSECKVRTRDEGDTKTDVHLVFWVKFNDSFFTVTNGTAYGSGADEKYEITGATVSIYDEDTLQGTGRIRKIFSVTGTDRFEYRITVKGVPNNKVDTMSADSTLTYSLNGAAQDPIVSARIRIAD
ncbi:MAG: hypothetical protein K6F68_04855 [Clostridiales bacterium]|nr:hypothetical protein [Clostridiales bacterium]